MKKIFTALLIVCSVTLCKAQQYLPPPVEWVKTYGGSRIQYVNSINETSDGGYIVTGETNSNDGDFAGTGWTGQNGKDAFIMKLDQNGNLQGVKKFGGTCIDYGVETFQTADGGYLFGGYTSCSVSGLWTTHSSANDYWVVKMNSNGVIQWAKCYGGTDNETLVSIIPASHGGYFLLGTGKSNDGDIDTAMGIQFVWVVRIDSVGNILWNKSYGTNFQVQLYHAKITSNRDGIDCYAYVNPLWLSGEGGDLENVDYLSQGGNPTDYENWVFKIDTSGTIVWSSLLGTDLVNSWGLIDYIVPLRNGNLFMEGIGLDQNCAYPNSFFSYYPILDTSGIRVDSFYYTCLLQWARVGTCGAESSDSMILLPLINDSIAKVNLDGDIMWITDVPDNGRNNCILNKSNGSFLVGGYSVGVLNNDNYADIRIVKYKNDLNCSLISNSISQVICAGDTFYCASTPLTTQGNYSFTVNSVTGCDSVINLVLSVLNPTVTNLSESICDGSVLDFNGQQISSEGEYSVTLNAINGCDSVVNLHLTILNSVSSSVTENICSGDIYNFNGVNLNASGIYIDTVNSVSGCDSIVTLNLIVETINTTIQQTNDTLIALGSGVIQWFNCNTQQTISGATQNIFVPNVTGNYAAIITEGNCTDTSACINMIVNSINSVVGNGLQFSLFPNPTNETVTVQFSQQTNCKLAITNTLGQIVFAKTINHKSSAGLREETINLQSLPSGLYFCSVKTEDVKTAQQKLVVQH